MFGYLFSSGQFLLMEKNEKTGYHKGSLETLLNERNELLRIAKIVEALIQYHASQLKKEGISPEKFLQELKEEKKRRAKEAEDEAETGVESFRL